MRTSIYWFFSRFNDTGFNSFIFDLILMDVSFINHQHLNSCVSVYSLLSGHIQKSISKKLYLRYVTNSPNCQCKHFNVLTLNIIHTFWTIKLDICVKIFWIIILSWMYIGIYSKVNNFCKMMHMIPVCVIKENAFTNISLIYLLSAIL